MTTVNPESIISPNKLALARVLDNIATDSNQDRMAALTSLTTEINQELNENVAKITTNFQA